MTMKLYEISNEFQRIVDLIENCDEITPEIVERIDSVSDNASAKVISVAAYIKNMETDVKNMDDHIKHLTERLRKKKYETNKKINKLENYLLYHMDILKLKKVESSEFDVQLRTDQYSLDLFDEKLLTKEYFKIKETLSISRKDIIKDLKIGCDVPGARFVTKKSVLIK